MTLVRERRHQQALRLTLPQSAGLFMNASPVSSSSLLSSSSSSSSSSLASSSCSSSPANMDTLSNFKKLSVLGSGNGGTVYKVSHKHTGAIFALKVVRFSEKDFRLIPAIREAEILQRVDSSECIVKCAGVFHDGGGFGFLMEYMDYGSLCDILCKKKRSSERAISWIVRSVLKGLKYLHGLGIVHRDIKPSNILVNARGEIKIADFGASRVVAKADDDRYSHECTCTHNDGCSGICAHVNMRRDQVKIVQSGTSQAVMNTSGDQYAYTCTCTQHNECNEVRTYLNTRGDQVKITDFAVNRVAVNTGDDRHAHACNGTCTCVNKGDQVKIANFGVNHVVVNTDSDEYAYTCTCTHNDACSEICTHMNTKEDVNIADFGVSRMVMNVRGDQSAYTCTSSHDNACKGTRAYMSPERMDPEQWDGEQCDDYAGDIWSLGVVAMECYMGRFPLVGEDEKLDWVTLMCAVCLGENVESSMLKMASPEFESFCRRCLERDWRKRGTLDELLLHPFVNKFEDSGGGDLLDSSD